MGMTDKQFDAYTQGQLFVLEKIQEELAEKGVKSADLDKFIKNLQDQLKRP